MTRNTCRERCWLELCVSQPFLHSAVFVALCEERRTVLLNLLMIETKAIFVRNAQNASPLWFCVLCLGKQGSSLLWPEPFHSSSLRCVPLGLGKQGAAPLRSVVEGEVPPSERWAGGCSFLPLSVWPLCPFGGAVWFLKAECFSYSRYFYSLLLNILWVFY